MPRSSNNFLLTLAFCSLVWPVTGQTTKSDLELLSSADFTKPEYHFHGSSFMWVPSASPLVRYNPVSLTFGALMYTYQNVISRHFSAGCLYNPSCSQYGRSLIREFGLVPGIIYSADRVLRCNRIAALDIKDSEVDEHDHKVHETTDAYR